MKNKNRILTESQKRQITENKEKVILESFASTFNKIKRIDESELGDGNAYYNNLKQSDATTRPSFEWAKNNLGDGVEFLKMQYPKETSINGHNYTELANHAQDEIRGGSDKIYFIYGERENPETGETYISSASVIANSNKKEVLSNTPINSRDGKGVNLYFIEA